MINQLNLQIKTHLINNKQIPKKWLNYKPLDNDKAQHLKAQ